MANFEVALAQTLEAEGGYSNDATDTGGETYCGISRVHNPNWPGWELVGHLPLVGIRRDLLDADVESFYRDIWDRLDLDALPHQGLAAELFDITVNMGLSRAVKFMQEGLNALNRDRWLWPDLKVDGGFGPVTSGILYDASAEYPMLIKVLIILRAAFYLNIVKKNPSQERFIRGWLNRVRITVEHHAS